MLASCKTGIKQTETGARNTEAQLLARCRAGDRDAFAQIVAAQERAVFRYACYMLGHREDALDIQQETFVRAYQAVGKFRGDCSLHTWLLKICANLCRTHLKRRARNESRFDEAEPDALAGGEADDPYRIAARSQEIEILRAALRSLPPAQRELIILREYEELSCKEIGVILSCATVTARVKLYRARKRLQERVEALWQSGEKR